MQANLKLTLALILAFVFVGSPIAQAQDQTLTQTLEVLVQSLEQWQIERLNASSETKNALLLLRETTQKSVLDTKEALARWEEKEDKALEQVTNEERVKCQVLLDPFVDDAEVLEQLTIEEHGKCLILNEAKKKARGLRSTLQLNMVNIQGIDVQLLQHAKEVEEEFNALTQELINVLSNLAAVLDKNKQ